MLKILLEEEAVEEEEEEEISEARGEDTFKEKNLIFIAYIAIEMDHMMHLHASFLATKLSRKEIKPKVKPMAKRKIKHLNPLTMLCHIVILE